VSGIVVLTATASEQELLAAGLEDGVEQQVAGRPWRDGLMAGRPTLLLCGGLGAVNTAHSLTCVLQSRRPSLLLQVGVGGAYPGAGLAIGDLALATSEQYGDLGIRTAAGWQPADAIGIPVLELDGVRYFNDFPLDAELVALATEALRRLPGTEGMVRTGPFVTVQECTGLAALAAERAARQGAICENMEGAAAAHLCRLYGVRFLELRGISNRVEDRHREAWDLPLAARRAQQAALALLRDPRLWEGPEP
jgi:futalosine hydrolase